MLTDWLTIVAICLLGAMSPGPSLAVVLRHTLSGGRRQGMLAALVHGLAVGLYALACISGVAFVITSSPLLFGVLQWGGAAYLAWLGVHGLLARSTATELPPVDARRAIRDGFLIVFLNPKIAVFFIALFAQTIGAETSLHIRLLYAGTALTADAGWYLCVAWLFSNPLWLGRLQRNAVWFERLFGLILIGLAGRLALALLPW